MGCFAQVNFEAKRRRRRDSASGGEAARLPGEGGLRAAPLRLSRNCSPGLLSPPRSAVPGGGAGWEGIRAGSSRLRKSPSFSYFLFYFLSFSLSPQPCGERG